MDESWMGREPIEVRGNAEGEQVECRFTRNSQDCALKPCGARRLMN
jgi:hypothetical protein